MCVCSLLPEGMQQSQGAGGGPVGSPGSAATVTEITTSEGFRQHCTDTSGLCIVATLDSSSAGFEAHKAAFQVSTVMAMTWLMTHNLCPKVAVCS